MARQLSLPGLGRLESIEEALQHRDQHPLDLDTWLAPGGELWHWVRDQGSRPDINDIIEKLTGSAGNQSGPPDWVDDLPSPAALQAIVVETVVDLIDDIRDALPDLVEDWPAWIHNPANLASVKAIAAEHVQDLIAEVRETLPEELQDWPGWASLGEGLPDLEAVRDHLGDIGQALHSADLSNLEEWRDAAQATLETIKQAAEDQFGDALSQSDGAQDIFEDFFDFRPDGAITPDL